MSSNSRLFAAELRALRADALERLRNTIRVARGNVGLACKSLGVSKSTLYNVASTVPEVRAILESHGMGSAGAVARANARSVENAAARRRAKHQS